MDQFVQLLRAAQGGQGVENLASLYGLSAQQAQRVMEALMPAFSAAMQRAMQSPDGMANLTVLMMSGPYGALYEHPPTAPNDLARPGNPVLDTVFGSPDVARAVADHAASTSGLATAVVKQVMPSFATLLLGGLAKSLAASGAMNQLLAASLARASGQPLPTGNPWIDALGNLLSPPPQAATRSTGNPWIDSFAQMMVQSPYGLRGETRRSPNPWEALAETITTAMTNFQMPMQAWTTAVAPKPEPKPAPPPPPAAPAPLPFQDYFAQFFAQGFPPGFSPFDLPKTGGTGSGPTGFYPFDFWSQMLDRASGRGHGGKKS
ncbi:hypothetical protein GCM10007301_31390 [Azorhizobium oxalatiphilum]|uniref:DUF937 domain-containing protein n=1 Tax=Azorhizobium oxalatiphilum TaxID=980631 RepID=A0A917FC70_9HYPH|nr:DUF937 domain-containing protein [Azorhizobium oxalatiphilum]GGF69448.1 hypothetical protein GCM10007301_31390 [Azorhizobium oxalatiphilum]